MTGLPCYEVIFHFKEYADAKSLVDANWNIEVDKRIWKIELRIKAERPDSSPP